MCAFFVKKNRVSASTRCSENLNVLKVRKSVVSPINAPTAESSTKNVAASGEIDTNEFTKLYQYFLKNKNVPINVISNVLKFSQNKFNFKEWKALLSDCPYKLKVNQTLHGILYGESIGFKGERKLLISKNAKFSDEQKEIFKKDVQTRLDIKRDIIGPFSTPPTPTYVCSRMHIVPKSSGKWRLVHDLSYPPRKSVNDGIDKNDFPCKLLCVDDAIKIIQNFKPGTCVLMKFDFSGAYKQVNVCLKDLDLGGFQFENKFYIDTRLTFGAVSSASIFCRYSDLFKWILEYHYGFKNKIINYMDDFCVICDPSEALELKMVFKRIAKNLGILLEDKKEVGPDFEVVFLGILLDSQKMQARIPPEKLIEILNFVEKFRKSNCTTIRELQKCIGKLQFVCKVVRAGRTFIGRLLEPLRGRRRFPSEKISLSVNQMRDLDWWIKFLPDYNGVSFFIDKNITPANFLQITCDACSVGGGASWGSKWLYVRWTGSDVDNDIQTKELDIIVRAASTCGKFCSGKRILFQTDNIAAMYAINKRAVKSKTMCFLLRCLYFVEAKYSFAISAVHLPGKQNIIADPLSRDNFPLFRYNLFKLFGTYPDKNPSKCIWPIMENQFL